MQWPWVQYFTVNPCTNPLVLSASCFWQYYNSLDMQNNQDFPLKPLENKLPLKQDPFMWSLMSSFLLLNKCFSFNLKTDFIILFWQLYNFSLSRILNLELMADHGSNAWKQYNTILVQMMENAQKHLQDLRYAKPCAMNILRVILNVFNHSYVGVGQ